MNLSCSLLLVAAVAAPSLPLAAQPTPPAPAGAASPRLVAALRPGRDVRVTAEEKYFEGRVRTVRGDTVTLDLGGGTREVRLGAVERAYVRTRATAQGAIIGGIAGAALVGALGLLAVQALCEQPSGCSSDYPTAILIGGGIGFGGGAIVGAGLGALSHRWQRVYP